MLPSPSSSSASSPSSPSSPQATSTPAPSPSGWPGESPVAGSPRPVAIDTALAADDSLAIMALLRDPAADVRAITVSGTGEVHCVPGLRNTRRRLAAFDRSDIPVACGRENAGPAGRWFPSAWRDGADRFYGIELPEVEGETSRQGTAADLLTGLAAEAGAAGTPPTVVPLGPWTNFADAAALDAARAGSLAGIHAMGGAIDVEGNIDIEGRAASTGPMAAARSPVPAHRLRRRATNG